MGGWDQNGFWGEWCGFNWLKIEVGGGLLWMRWWTFGFWRRGVSCIIFHCYVKQWNIWWYIRFSWRSPNNGVRSVPLKRRSVSMTVHGTLIFVLF
jgi:hypothetical protein